MIQLQGNSSLEFYKGSGYMRCQYLSISVNFQFSDAWFFSFSKRYEFTIVINVISSIYWWSAKQWSHLKKPQCWQHNITHDPSWMLRQICFLIFCYYKKCFLFPVCKNISHDVQPTLYNRCTAKEYQLYRPGSNANCWRPALNPNTQQPPPAIRPDGKRGFNSA